MYAVVCIRWLRNSDQSGEFIVDYSTRYREANGLARHHFNSHMDMMARHDYNAIAQDFDIDIDNLSVALADDDSIFYYFRYEVRTYD